VFAKPDEPTIIVLPELEDIPSEDIEVSDPPQYGSMTVNDDSTLTYVSELEDPTSTLVDEFEVTYTDLSGAVVVTGREIVLAQQGDVPSIIQTGAKLNDRAIKLIYVFSIGVLVMVLITYRRRRTSIVKAFSLVSATALALTLVVHPISQPAADAACKPVKPKGKTIGRIDVGNVDMPIKAFTYPAGGVMEPQPTTLSAGLSMRHMPLSSQLGTSVITWHKDYNGCDNQLNTFFYKKVGDRFSITDENGDTQRFKVSRKLIVRKGDYKKSWFTLVGPRQLTLVTCTGRFKNGHYEDNLVLLATKIG